MVIEPDEPAEEKSEEVAMTMDPEIQAMSKVAEALSNLEEPAKERVLRWAIDRYVSSGIPMGIEEQKIRLTRLTSPSSAT